MNPNIKLTVCDLRLNFTIFTRGGIRFFKLRDRKITFGSYLNPYKQGCGSGSTFAGKDGY
jgi:hypothetical protein